MNKKTFFDGLGKEQELEIDPRLAIQMSFGTIRYLMDAIVELVTNSDDSYRRLEQKGIVTEGKIIIKVQRLRYGKCTQLEVIDFAEGMDKDQLEEKLRFGGELSGFERGENVRGLFGRGLKESIIALGRGQIYTIQNDMLSTAILWGESIGGRFRISETSHVASKEERTIIDILKGNGTAVKILVTNEKIKCPDKKTLSGQIANHFSLRDINLATNRKIILKFESQKRNIKNTEVENIVYNPPQGKEKITKLIRLPDYEDELEIKIYESDHELTTPYNDPYAQAGLLVKTCGAILDNQLFKYEHERAGCFFFGEVMWPNLVTRLRNNEALVDPNRGGIEWKYQVCRVLQNEVEKILGEFVDEKRKHIERKPSDPTPEKIGRLNKRICSLLNNLAKTEMADIPPGDIIINPSEKKLMTILTVKPSYANIEINKERPFSIYAPMNIIDIGIGNSCQVEISSNNPNIQVLDPVVKLNPHREYSDVFYGIFRIIGRVDGEEGTVTCNLGKNWANTTVRVAPFGKKGPRKKPSGGFFHDIKPDSEENPIQRARYDKNNRIIMIYTKFPIVQKYFEDNLNFKKDESKTMYAELVGEAFCEFVARENVDRGNPPAMGDPIGAFSLAMDIAQKKYLHQIHEAILKHKL